jgi:hypothetical protein
MCRHIPIAVNSKKEVPLYRKNYMEINLCVYCYIITIKKMLLTDFAGKKENTFLLHSLHFIRKSIGFRNN